MKTKLIATLMALLLTACAVAPMGPSVQVLPNSSKPFQVFQQDQRECNQYAQTQIAGQVDAANANAVGTVVISTFLGALLGSAASTHGYQGRHYSHPGNNLTGTGAAIGAGAGVAIGANQSERDQGSIQGQYDNAYVQCMYSKGNQVR